MKMRGGISVKIFADYHTHTIYSHGKGTIRDNVEAAVKKGLREILISDHGSSHVTFGVKRSNFPVMRREIDELQKEFHDIKIMLGVEANLISMDGDIDVNEEEKKYFDMLLMGFHNGAMPVSIGDGFRLYIKNYTSFVLPSLREGCRKANTDAYIKALERHKIDILTHPGAKIDIDIKRLARAAGKAGTALEINSSHHNLTYEYLVEASKEDVRFVIDSDAHIPGNVGNFSWAVATAERAGIPVSRIINAEE